MDLIKVKIKEAESKMVRDYVEDIEAELETLSSVNKGA